MTQQEFAENIKVAPATLSSIFTGRTAPSLKIVEAIKSRFPDISTDWLMFGRGAMTDYKSSEAGASFEHPSSTEPVAALDFGLSQMAAPDADQNSGEAPPIDNGIGQTAKRQPQFGNVQLVNNCDKKERKIAEIRIFYDDQTWETFVPKK